MTIRERYDWVMAAIGQGQTVYFLTCTRATKITPKNAAQWAATGRPVLKVTTDERGLDHLMLASGRGYVRADHCAIQMEG